MGSMLPEIGAGLAGLVLRELAAADTDAYHALLDRNREHIGRHGNYTAEASATRERVAESSPTRQIRTSGSVSGWPGS